MCSVRHSFLFSGSGVVIEFHWWRIIARFLLFQLLVELRIIENTLLSWVTNCCINFPSHDLSVWDSLPNLGFTYASFPNSTSSVFHIAPSQMFMTYRFHWVITNVSTIWHILILYLQSLFSPWLLCLPWLSRLETCQSWCYIWETFCYNIALLFSTVEYDGHLSTTSQVWILIGERSLDSFIHDFEVFI